MKSYKSIAEAAGTTVDVVREAAKTVYEEVTGWRDALDPNPWHSYRTKGEALEAIAKRKQAELDKTKAERETIKADTEAAYKLMTAAGYETHGDTDKVTAIVSSLKTLADTKGVTVSELTVDDFRAITRKDCSDTPAQNPTKNTVTNSNKSKANTMKNEDFEAYAFIGYDRENDEFTEDYPHEIIAHIDGNIETWRTKCVGGFLKYYRAKAERYTEEAWRKCLDNSDANDAMDDMTREDFEHYAYSGLLFG